MDTVKGCRRVATMQDLSCWGRCSLTVALPLLSCAGLEACPVPTALLSTHTGVDGPYVQSLGEAMEGILAHWKRMELRFDAIYIGYLGSEEKIAVAERFIETFRRPGTLVLVDPVMADNGRLYTGFGEGYAAAMRRLCAAADVIVPNLTEAALLLGEPYAETYDKEYVEGLLRRLGQSGARRVVLTGVRPNESEIGAALYDPAAGRARFVFHSSAAGSYHGTGDIFASVLTAGLVRGLVPERAVRAAVDFTARCIEYTDSCGAPPLGGVLFEPCLPGLSDLLR